MQAILAIAGLGREQGVIIAQVLIAMILGGIIGYEREGADKPAGLRTHMLLAGAAALFVGLGSLIIPQFAVGMAPGQIRSDPIRIFEAIITGVSFIGAGTIIFHRESGRVEGITTAASLLITAAIGATIGLGEWLLGAILTGIVFIVLNFVGRITHKKHRADLESSGPPQEH